MEEAHNSIQKAKHLINLKRHTQAFVELEKLIEKDNGNYEALITLISGLIDTDDYVKAQKYWNFLIKVAPENAEVHFYHSVILHGLGKNEVAEKAIQDTIALNPNLSFAWAFWAYLKIEQKEWKKALEYSEIGLEIDPENTQCLNIRTTCLLKLNRKQEIDDNVNHSLSINPYDDYTHTNIGWTKLENNEVIEAEQHFKEALSINPENSFAQSGLKSTIQARNLFYRLFLNYSFWLSNKKREMQWAIIILFLGGQKILPYPFNYFVVIFILLTWLINPIADFVLFFDKMGKYLLLKHQKIGALVIGSLLLFSVFSSILIYFFGKNDLAMTYLLFGVYGSLPFSTYTFSKKNFSKKWLMAYSSFIVLFGALSIFAITIGGFYNFESEFQTFSLMAVASTWIGAFLNK